MVNDDHSRLSKSNKSEEDKQRKQEQELKREKMKKLGLDLNLSGVTTVKNMGLSGELKVEEEERNYDEDDEIESAWAVEIERRVAEVESGTIVGMPFEEVIAQARAA